MAKEETAEDGYVSDHSEITFAELGAAVEVLTRYVDDHASIDCVEIHGTVDDKMIVRTIMIQAIDVDI